MSYKHLSIGKKIAAVFSVIAVINILFGLFLASELRGVRDRVLNFTDSTLPSVISVENLLYDVSYVRRAQFALLMVEDVVDRQVRRGRIRRAWARWSRRSAPMARPQWGRARTPGVQPGQAALAAVSGAVNRVDQLFSLGDREQARDVLFGSNAAYTELEQSVNALVEVNLGFVRENRGSLLGSVNRVTLFASASIGALLLFMGVMTWFLTRQICLPLQAVVARPTPSRRGSDPMTWIAGTSDRMSSACWPGPPSRCRTT